MQLDEDCRKVYDMALLYSPDAGILFQVLLLTGAREGEVVDRDRWSLVGDSEIILQPQKGNSPRSFQQAAFPSYFLKWLTGSGWPRQLVSGSNLRRLVAKFSLYPDLHAGGKVCSVHRYRYRYMRDLALQGYTVDEVRVAMGLSSMTVTASYLTRDLVP